MCKAMRAEDRARKKPDADEGSAKVQHLPDPLRNAGIWMAPQVSHLEAEGLAFVPASQAALEGGHKLLGISWLDDSGQLKIETD